jgi:hypothetical protein
MQAKQEKYLGWWDVQEYKLCLFSIITVRKGGEEITAALCSSSVHMEWRLFWPDPLTHFTQKGLGNLIYPGQCMTEGQRYAYMHVLIGLVKGIASNWDYDVRWWQLEKVQLSFQHAFPSFFCNFASHIPCPAFELSPWHILPKSLPINRRLLRAYLGRVNHDLGLYSISMTRQISCRQLNK